MTDVRVLGGRGKHIKFSFIDDFIAYLNSDESEDGEAVEIHTTIDEQPMILVGIISKFKEKEEVHQRMAIPDELRNSPSAMEHYFHMRLPDKITVHTIQLVSTKPVHDIEPHLERIIGEIHHNETSPLMNPDNYCFNRFIPEPKELGFQQDDDRKWYDRYDRKGNPIKRKYAKRR